MSKLSDQSITSRRGALVSLASVAAMVPASAVAAAVCTFDPIFAMIEGHRAAEAAFIAALNRVPNDFHHPEHAASDAAADDAGDAAHSALVAMLNTAPTTLAGAVALLRYLSEASANDNHYLRHSCGENDERGADALVASLIAGLAPLVRQ